MAPKLDHILNLTAFTFFSIVLFCLILLTPADAIYQCYVTQRLINIFFIAGAYIATSLLAVLIYATRIYTNRSVLTGIPKAWIPVEKEDVGSSVRRLVMEGLARSSIIAYQARPRDVGASDDVGINGDGDVGGEYRALMVDRRRPPWGRVEHPGWSAPEAGDLPDLPYRTVVQELPHLIEAKAVSMAPPDPVFTATTTGFYEEGQEQDQAIPDTRVVEVLQRSAAMGVREYLQHLTALGVIQPPEVGAEFVALYERARFSAHELYEEEFRELMHVFAEVLRGMKSLGPQMVDEIRDGNGDETSSRDDITESVIGPSDEEGETDTVDYHDYGYYPDSEAGSRGRSSASLSSRKDHGYYSGYHMPTPYQRLVAPRTPSMRSLHQEPSNSSGSVIHSVPYVYRQE